MTADTDVVIVGGGIAGASLAAALAAHGRSVVVLEATARFTDRVRGESMMPWGVAEAQRLGVVDALLAAGAHVAPSWKRYSESAMEPREIPVGLLVPGIGGTLNLDHPTACQALLDAATAAGATVERGVSVVSLDGSTDPPLVTYRRRGATRHVSPQIVVGADGRTSAVRRAVGVDLESSDATAVIAGLLLEGVGGPTDHDVVAEHDLGMSLLLHQREGRARAYHVVPPALRSRYAGAPGAHRFLADLAGIPVLAGAITSARPAGPCGAFPNVQTWSGLPAAGPVVLIGDAAGQSDPAIGCGLSVAMRDARVVRDLLLEGACTAEHFRGYGAERAERMRRLRAIAALMVDSVVTPGPDRSARRARFADAMAAFDPAVFPLILGMFTGPETIPAELVAGGGPAAASAA